MRFTTYGFAAAGLTAAVLAVGVVPAHAAEAIPPLSQQPSLSASQATTSTSVFVDTVHAGDSAIVGSVDGEASKVTLEGVEGARLGAAVAQDGSFEVSLAPFASRLRPMQSVTVNAFDSSGNKVGASTVLVEFKAPAPVPERDLIVDRVTTDSKNVTGSATPGTSVLLEGLDGARLGAIVTSDGKYSIGVAGRGLSVGQALKVVNIDSRTQQPLGKQAEVVVAAGSSGESDGSEAGGIEVDPFHLGQVTLTGTAPADSVHVAVEVFGTSEFGTLDASGTFSVSLGRLAYMLFPGGKISVWAINAEGIVTETEVTISH